MSQEYAGQDPLKIAKQAERDLNSHAAKWGHNTGYDAMSGHHGIGASDSTSESGVDESVRQKFPGADVIYGSAASGAGGNREIPLSKGGDINPQTGKPYKARDYEGIRGPEDMASTYAADNPGSDGVRENVRQGGETIRPAAQLSNEADRYDSVRMVQ